MAAEPVEAPEPGMRRIELWVWDQDSPEFRAALERSAAAMRSRAASAEEREVLAWGEAATAELWAGIDEAEERAGRGGPV